MSCICVGLANSKCNLGLKRGRKGKPRKRERKKERSNSPNQSFISSAIELMVY
jgi:hypothetical protein